jgi:hypothetical protein
MDHAFDFVQQNKNRQGIIDNGDNGDEAQKKGQQR